MKFGTTVTNPTKRGSESGYTQCTYCKLYYTKLGIGRHWSRCRSNPKNQSNKEGVIYSKTELPKLIRDTTLLTVESPKEPK